MEDIDLDDIEEVRSYELDADRLEMLENGHDDFDDVLSNSSDPITLEGEEPPYRIIDGRHRIYLARERGYSSVPAQIL